MSRIYWHPHVTCRPHVRWRVYILDVTSIQDGNALDMSNQCRLASLYYMDKNTWWPPRARLGGEGVFFHSIPVANNDLAYILICYGEYYRNYRCKFRQRRAGLFLEIWNWEGIEKCKGGVKLSDVQSSTSLTLKNKKRLHWVGGRVSFYNWWGSLPPPPYLGGVKYQYSRVCIRVIVCVCDATKLLWNKKNSYFKSI